LLIDYLWRSPLGCGFRSPSQGIVSNQIIDNPDRIKQQINKLSAGGGTAIDEEAAVRNWGTGKGKRNNFPGISVNRWWNEHGDNNRALNLLTAASYNLTLNTLGFGDHWNQDILEQIADVGGGTLSYSTAWSSSGRVWSLVQSDAGGGFNYLLLSTSKMRGREDSNQSLSCSRYNWATINKADGRFALGRLDEDVQRVVCEPVHRPVVGRQTQLQLYKCVMITQLQMNRVTFRVIPVEANFVRFTNPLFHQVQPYILALGSTVKLRWRQNYNKAIGRSNYVTNRS